MPSCCCSGCKPRKAKKICLGRCGIAKHRCIEKEDIKPGPVPKHMGWLYTAKDSPEHQLRCGWRPGHISCAVLRRIERHNCQKISDCCPSGKSCSRPSVVLCGIPCPAPVCPPPSCQPPSCPAVCPLATCPGEPLLRITRHGGQYTITTLPATLDNSPSGPYPLKYFIDNDDGGTNDKARYSIEGKFNDNQFDYTSSTGSFVIDFTPPPGKC